MNTNGTLGASENREVWQKLERESKQDPSAPLKTRDKGCLAETWTWTQKWISRATGQRHSQDVIVHFEFGYHPFHHPWLSQRRRQRGRNTDFQFRRQEQIERRWGCVNAFTQKHLQCMCTNVSSTMHKIHRFHKPLHGPRGTDESLSNTATYSGSDQVFNFLASGFDLDREKRWYTWQAACNPNPGKHPLSLYKIHLGNNTSILFKQVAKLMPTEISESYLHHYENLKPC